MVSGFSQDADHNAIFVSAGESVAQRAICRLAFVAVLDAMSRRVARVSFSHDARDIDTSRECRYRKARMEKRVIRIGV